MQFDGEKREVEGVDIMKGEATPLLPAGKAVVDLSQKLKSDADIVRLAAELKNSPTIKEIRLPSDLKISDSALLKLQAAMTTNYVIPCRTNPLAAPPAPAFMPPPPPILHDPFMMASAPAPSLAAYLSRFLCHTLH